MNDSLATKLPRQDTIPDPGHRDFFRALQMGFCVLEPLRDANGRARDARILETNPWFERLLGRSDLVGTTFLDLFPGLDDSWFEVYDAALRENRAVRFEKHHAPSDRWYELNASPFGPPGPGRMAVVFGDVTERKRAEQAARESEARKSFMMRLEDALRPLESAAAMQETVCRLLGGHLNADRVFFGDTEVGLGRSEILPDYRREGLPSVAGPYDPEDFKEAMDLLRAGRPVRLEDLEKAGGLSERTRASLRALGAGAVFSAPLHKDDRLQGELTVLFTRPHAWKEDEASLIQEVLERAWLAAKRAKAEEELRLSEEKYHTLFDSVDEAFCIAEMILDAEGKAVDMLFVETNPAFARHTGMELAGRRAREALPDYEDFWIDLYAHVARTGEVVRREHPVRGLGGQWFRVSAFRRGGPERPQVAILFTNITERKRAQFALQDFNARLEQDVRERTAELNESKDLLQAVLDASPFRIDYLAAVRGPDGGIVDFESRLANAAARLHSGDRSDAPPRYAELFPGIRDTGAFERLREVVETGQKADFEVRYDKDGYQNWFHIVAVRLLDGMVMTSEDITERRRDEEERLRNAREKLELEEARRQELLAAILDTQEAERKRIAESLHNGIGQILYGIQLNLDQTRLRAGERWQEHHQAQHRATQRLLLGAIEETRRISHELMPSILEDFGLRFALQEICKQFDGLMEVDCAFQDLPDKVQPYIEVALYRIVQELFNNIVKHAKALKVSVNLGFDGETYRLEVRDNGLGFRGERKIEGIGLRTIRDKIGLLGGDFRVESGDSGTTVRILIPDRMRRARPPHDEASPVG